MFLPSAGEQALGKETEESSSHSMRRQLPTSQSNLKESTASAMAPEE